jgi:chromosome segregation ATPase
MYSSYSSPLWRTTALLVFLGSVAYMTPAQQDASQPSGVDPVAEAARKTRAEQKAESKPKKVFTNDDIPSAPASTATPAQNNDQSAAKPGATASGKKGDSKPQVKDETYWRARFKEIHDKISQTQQELDVLQRELNKDSVQYYSDPQKALMQQYDRSDINEKNAKIDAKKKELDALNQKLSDTEDELRQSGGDPGWAR